MKIKLKDIELDNINYKLNTNNGIGCSNSSKMINFTYLGNELEFQTPKVMIKKIIKENNKEYLLLKIIGTEACRLFYSKIIEMEQHHNKNLNKKWFDSRLPINDIKTVFDDDCFMVKIPFKYSKPGINTFYTDGRLFNYYHLKEGMEIICLLTINNIWINFDNITSYNLTVKEILVTK